MKKSDSHPNIIHSWFLKEKCKNSPHSPDKPLITIETDKSNIWATEDVPDDVTHPGADFFRTSALVMTRHYNDQTDADWANLDNGNLYIFPEEHTTFNSTPPSDPKKEETSEHLGKEIHRLNPLFSLFANNSIVNNKNLLFRPIHDPRDEVPPIRIPDITYATFEFSKISINLPSSNNSNNNNLDFISPIFLSMYVFDAIEGKRVTETWSFLPTNFREQVSKLPSFEVIFSSPTNASFAIHRPRVANVDDSEYTKGLFLIVVLDRPLMPKAGKDINNFYEKPSEANRKKALNTYADMNHEGWLVTFGYGAIPVSDILKILGQNDNNGGEPSTIEFKNIIETSQADEQFFQHKLNKVRKHPKHLPLTVTFNVKKEDENKILKAQQQQKTSLRNNSNNDTNPSNVNSTNNNESTQKKVNFSTTNENTTNKNDNNNCKNDNNGQEDVSDINLMHQFYTVNPFFKLKYQNTMVLKLLTVKLARASALKKQNIAIVLAFTNRGQTINAFRGQMVYKTHCQYHTPTPKFHEDVFITLPDKLTPTMSVFFQIFDLDSKKGGEPKKIGEASMPLISVSTGLPLVNGEQRIPIKNFLIKESSSNEKDSSSSGDKESYLFVSTTMRCSSNPSNPAVASILNGDFSTNITDGLTFDDVIPYLPPILDVILKHISEEDDMNSFAALLNVIDNFPVATSDPRYYDFEEKYSKMKIQPYDHLRFYVKYCALRNCNADGLFRKLISFWLVKARSEAVNEIRSDIRSAPFLIDLLTKAIAINNELVKWPFFYELIFTLQDIVFKFRPNSGTSSSAHSSVPSSHSGAHSSHSSANFSSNSANSNSTNNNGNESNNNISNSNNVNSDNFKSNNFNSNNSNSNNHEGGDNSNTNTPNIASPPTDLAAGSSSALGQSSPGSSRNHVHNQATTATPFIDKIVQTGVRLSHSLALLYKDLSELVDSSVVIQLCRRHCNKFEVRKNRYDQVLFVNFLSDILSPKSLALFCVPLDQIPVTFTYTPPKNGGHGSVIRVFNNTPSSDHTNTNNANNSNTNNSNNNNLNEKNAQNCGQNLTPNGQNNVRNNRRRKTTLMIKTTSGEKNYYTTQACFFAQYILPHIEEGLATREYISQVFSIIYKVLICYTSEELKAISEGLSTIIAMIGRNEEIFMLNYEKGTTDQKIRHLVSLIFPFVVTVFLMTLYNIDKVDNKEFGHCCRLVIETANHALLMANANASATKDFLMEQICDLDGVLKNAVTFKPKETLSKAPPLYYNPVSNSTNSKGDNKDKKKKDKKDRKERKDNKKDKDNIDDDTDNKDNNKEGNDGSDNKDDNDMKAEARPSLHSGGRGKLPPISPAFKINNLFLTELKVDDFWKKFDFWAQMICINFTTRSDSIHCFSDILVTLSNCHISSSLFSIYKQSIVHYCRQNPEKIFGHQYSRTYKLVEYIIKNISAHNVELLDRLWEIEEKKYHSANRCRSFFLNSISKLISPSEISNISQYLSKTVHYGTTISRYAELRLKLSQTNPNDENNHEFIADVMLDLAQFFIPSPDSRVRQLLELGQFHLTYNYFSEAAVAQLTAAALIAEYLNVLKRLPVDQRVFSDERHPCTNFTAACPSASSELCPDVISRDVPCVPGFCTSKHFCECGLIFVIQAAMDTCKRAKLYELSTKIHSLLRPLVEYRRLWKVLEKHFQNGALSWRVLGVMGTKSDRSLGNYYRVELQSGEIYIYRETNMANLWQVNDKLKLRCMTDAKGKQVVVINDGVNLTEVLNSRGTNKQEDAEKFYYVHVKAVEQYFTTEERETRVSVFEQNHNISRFYFDLPYSKSAQSSIEHCYLKRTIYTLPHPMPYIVSRVLVPPKNIESIEFTPIEFCCQSLQKQVDNINEARNRGDFVSLQPLIQGSLLVQVNEGPKKMAEVFLTGVVENEFTKRLRSIFRKFLKANKKAVHSHGEWVTRNPAFQLLQEELELGLNRLSSTLQPYLK